MPRRSLAMRVGRVLIGEAKVYEPGRTARELVREPARGLAVGDVALGIRGEVSAPTSTERYDSVEGSADGKYKEVRIWPTLTQDSPRAKLQQTVCVCVCVLAVHCVFRRAVLPRICSPLLQRNVARPRYGHDAARSRGHDEWSYRRIRRAPLHQY
eukprot:SAG11_NODE_20_length_25330_cov_18.348143_7_plen_155_part_00